MSDLTPEQYWLSFCAEWDTLSRACDENGQTQMSEFFAELSDTAGDMWQHLHHSS